MASWNARKLDRWRHGPEHDKLLAEIIDRNSWSSKQFVEYQNRALGEIIQKAANNVPYYRQIFAEHQIDPASIVSVDDLPKLPILEKTTARENPKSLLDETVDRRKLIVTNTSGTTGTPVNLYHGVLDESATFAYVEARCHMVADMMRRRNRSVSLGGHLVAAPNRSTPPFWVHNHRWNQLYMSSYHLSPTNLGHYVDAIRRYAPEYIEGYPSSVYAVAQYMVDNNLDPMPIKACFTTAETLFDYHRQAIRSAFGCKTYNQYGCCEQVIFASECNAGSMHLTPEVGIVEVVDDNDRPLPAGQSGKLICTGLISSVQPLIRYRLGDMGALGTEQCSCGSSLPVLKSIDGRVDAVLITRDGRRIGRLDPVFKGAKGIGEAQIVQDDYDTFRILIVPGPDYSNADGKVVAANLAQRLGRVNIQVRIVDSITRTASGKFRAVVCNLPKEARESVADNRTK